MDKIVLYDDPVGSEPKVVRYLRSCECGNRAYRLAEITAEAFGLAWYWVDDLTIAGKHILLENGKVIELR